MGFCFSVFIFDIHVYAHINSILQPIVQSIIDNLVVFLFELPVTIRIICKSLSLYHFLNLNMLYRSFRVICILCEKIHLFALDQLCATCAYKLWYFCQPIGQSIQPIKR